MSDQKSDSCKREKILKVIKEFKDVFPEEMPSGLPPLRGIEHQIYLVPRAVLLNRLAYRSPPEKTKELRRQVEDLLSKGYVRESLSPYVVPVLLNPKKYSYVVSSQGLQMNQEKVKTIKEWPTPKNASEVRSFHKLASFDSIFIKDFSTIANPLMNLIKKMNGFKWEENQEKAFKLLKERLSSSHLLALSNFKEMFEIEYDASGVGIGGLSIQKLMANGRWSIEPLDNFLRPSLRRTCAMGRILFLSLSLLTIELDIPLLILLLRFLDGKQKAEFVKSIHAKKRVFFLPADWVWVHFQKERFPSQRKNKVHARGDSPFQALECIGDNAYIIHLPGEDSRINLFKVGADNMNRKS
ncbi:hypothetical protein M9H77_26686 [Catharanthus roseus]|uniref:Uncharacterized protein n=1 Tax=Catharanthus roseus TaxID=4058 RepID=A0ACC0AEM9_CATRO|nr:hypothetical protein M9H77_26686 [Catharanthus roseus]